MACDIVERRIPFWKSFTVFNVAQVDGLPARDLAPPKPQVERLANVDAYLDAVGATVHLGGDRVYYSPATDSITLPRPEQFESGAAFYGTALHEHAHYADRRVMPLRTKFARTNQAYPPAGLGIKKRASTTAGRTASTLQRACTSAPRADQEAIAVYGVPLICNTDQGSQFTSVAFVTMLQQNGIDVSME